MEDVHRRVQRPPYCIHRRFEDLLCTWWFVTESKKYGRYTADSTADRCTGLRSVERFGMVRSIRYGFRLGGQRALVHPPPIPQIWHTC